jgi:hypothetical protein
MDRKNTKNPFAGFLDHGINISLMHSFILQRIWFKLIRHIGFFAALLQLSKIVFQISNFFSLSITEEKYCKSGYLCIGEIYAN